MLYRNLLTCAILGLVIVAVAGCARTARDTTGFALENTANVEISLDAAFQVSKDVLREQGFELYTRDKRGHLVAYTPVKRTLGFLTPRRTQYTIDLAPVSEQETFVRIEAVRQVYGVTLLTYPGWHDRKTGDDTGAAAILEAIQSQAAAKS